jgi:polygalacturonase
MFNLVFASCSSATFELINNDVYYTSFPYDVYVDDELTIKDGKTNIFSLFNLEQKRRYKVKLVQGEKSETVEIETKAIYVTFNVKDFGAVGDGTTDDTKAIQSAIIACPKNGRVLFEEGIYLSSPLYLKSDIIIELKKGAMIKGSSKKEDYPIMPGQVKLTNEDDYYQLGTWEGNASNNYVSLITGIGVSNVNIVGEGIIDGGALEAIWWKEAKPARYGNRPRTIFLNKCSDIVIQGITIQNSPSWTIHPYFSKDLKFLDLKIINPKDSPNTDGLNPESSSFITILGVIFSVGDDCIAIKSGKIEMGKRYKTPSSNIEIRNCLMQFGHGAVVLGSEMSGGIKDLKVERCHFYNTDRGLRIKTRRGRGKDAIIDGITFKNITMDGVLTPLVINMFYFCDPDGKTEYVHSKEKLPVDDRTPYLGRFYFKDMKCTNCEYSSGYFVGLPEMKIQEIVLENIDFSFKEDAGKGYPAMMSFIEMQSKQGLYFYNVNKVRVKNVTFANIEGKDIDLVNVDNFTKE